MWLACLKRQATKERLRSCGMEVEPAGCVLCSQQIQHLFFECSFSSSIWEAILHRFQVCRRAEKGGNRAQLSDRVKVKINITHKVCKMEFPICQNLLKSTFPKISN